MPSLPELLMEHKDRKRISFGEMSTLTGVPKPTLAWLSKQTGTFTTSPENVQKLATGLRIPLRQVQLAAITSAGLMPDDWAGSMRLASVTGEVDKLSDADFALVQELIVRLAQGGSDG